MHRTEGDNYQDVGGLNLFTDGPPGTTVTDDWLNAVQEELLDFIVNMGGQAAKTASTDTRNQLKAALLNTVGRGFIATDEARVGKNAATTYFVNPLAIHIDDGTNFGIYRLEAQITKTDGALAASTRYYIFAEIPSSGSVLTASEISHSSTLPTYSTAKRGWYDTATGTKRCIAVMLTTAGSNWEDDTYVGRWCHIANGTQVINHMPSNVPTAVTITSIPPWGVPQLINLTWEMRRTGGGAADAFASAGPNSDAGMKLGQVLAGFTTLQMNTTDIMTDDARQVYSHWDAVTATNEIKAWLNGFRLPEGF